MKIKRSDLKRIIESFLKEEDEPKQASEEEIEQSIRDAEDDIIANQTADKRKEFLKKHGKKIPENVIQALGSMARPLVLKLNKSGLKDDSVLLSRVFSFLRKGENQTAIDILKSVKEVPITAGRNTKKIIKRKLSPEGLNAINRTDDYSQIINVIEKYIDAGKKEVKDDYDFLSRVKYIQTMLKELGFKDYDNKDILLDGSLGPSTRVAISNFLKSINDDVAIFDQLGIERLEDDPLFDELNIKKEGGEGSWKKLTMKLLPAPLNIDNPIDGLIFMLEKYKEQPEEESESTSSEPIAREKSEPKKEQPEETSEEIPDASPINHEDKYGEELNKEPAGNMVNLLKIKPDQIAKNPWWNQGTVSVNVNAKDIYDITDSSFKNVKLKFTTFGNVGKESGTYQANHIFQSTGRNAIDIYWLGPKVGEGSIKLDGDGFNNYKINGYYRKKDGTLVPKDTVS